MRETVVVTGDSRGLGAEIVRQLLAYTDRYVVGISRSEKPENDFGISAGNRFTHVRYDLEDIDGIKDLYKKIIKPFGPIVGLVNNSAAAYDDIVTNLNLERLERMFKVNVFAAMALTKYMIRDMLLNACGGSIVHITSVCAHTGYKGLAMYASTKGAMESYSRTVAREWGELSIRSNCVAPGFMETEMSQGLSAEQRQKIYQRTSLKKQTDLCSVASTVLFLLSEESASITGQVIHVDNGSL